MSVSVANTYLTVYQENNSDTILRFIKECYPLNYVKCFTSVRGNI